jgi:anti-sigma-K factor RskA
MRVDPEEHERIEELLAGYALRSLSGDEARKADRLLSDHVPDCETCRATLRAFTDIAADLALAADPAAPPETLLPRIHREMEPRIRRSGARWAGVAAGLAVVVISGGLAISQALRAGSLSEEQRQLIAAMSAANQPGANNLSIGAADPGGPDPVLGVTAPKQRQLYLVGQDIPVPQPGYVYRIWLIEEGTPVYAGEFVGGEDVTVEVIEVDPAVLDSVRITVERAGSEPTAPGRIVWEAAA